MKHHKETEVLVVGAGPVGMFAALLLTRAGIDVEIIDQSERTASRSYGCGLHPHSLHLLNDAGLFDSVRDAGYRVDAVAFYDHARRRAEVDLSRLSGEFPYALALPQDTLEGMLEKELEAEGKNHIRWNHRLSELNHSGGGVVAVVEQLGWSAQGYVVPHMEEVIEGELEVKADFVIGADGPASEVRTCLNIDWAPVGASELFALCDFETDAEIGREARVLLAGHETEMLWPLSANAARWTLRVGSPDGPSDAPHKERTRIIVRESADRATAFQQWVQARTPWFAPPVKAINWLRDVPFTPRLAKEFGHGRGWLVGDAAHTSGPLGFQSINVGLSEAVELADKLKRILRDDASMDLLETYGRNRRREWECLFDLSHAVVPETGADPWVKENAARILASLPASSEELVSLARQLGLDFSADAQKRVLEFETA